MMHRRFLLFLVTVALVLRQHASDAVECAIPSEPKTRIFNSVGDYQYNKQSFDPVTSGWLGSTVEFNSSTVIRVLQKNIFVTFDSQHITTMILSGKQIEQIDDGAFIELDCVHELLLNHNNISKLSKNTFQGLYHLEKLDLSDNRLNHLPDVLFVYVPRLKFLDLSRNRIGIIESMAFKDLNFLEVLNLEHNGLDRLPDKVFEPVHKLKTLNLAWNTLKDIQPEKWTGLELLESLNLAGNGLDHFDPNYNFHFSSVKALNLSSNFLSMLNVMALHRHLPKLELIDLSNNSWLCSELESVVQNLSILKIRFVVANVASSSVQGIACSETPLVFTSERTRESTTTSVNTTTEHQLVLNKSSIERLVEKKFKESSEDMKNSIRNLQNMVICLFCILGVFVVFEIFLRTECCMVILKRFRGGNHMYFDNSNVENFRLLHR